MDLDEHVVEEGMEAELRRSYSHIAPSAMQVHSTRDPMENRLAMKVMMRAPFWNAADEAEEALWSADMVKWLRNMLYKVSSNVGAFNKMRRHLGSAELIFQWLDLDFSGAPTVSVRLDEKGAVPEGTLTLIEEARARCVDRASVDHIVIEASEVRFADAD